MARKLRVFNGRGDYGYNGFDGHFYVCAESKAEAVRLLKQAGHSHINQNEFETYYSKDCWGTRMDKLVPVREKGVWFVPKGDEFNDKAVPKRLI